MAQLFRGSEACHAKPWLRHPEGPRFHQRAEGSRGDHALKFDAHEIPRYAEKATPLGMTHQRKRLLL
jgi:hypothetical protein